MSVVSRTLSDADMENLRRMTQNREPVGKTPGSHDSPLPLRAKTLSRLATCQRWGWLKVN
jgi:hypothetical protein